MTLLYYHLLHSHGNPKAGILFLEIRAQPLIQKSECKCILSNLLPKLFLHSRTQQQTIYKSVYPLLTPYAPLSLCPYTLINQAQNRKLYRFSLQKQRLDIHNMYNNTYNPMTKINLLLFSWIAIMLAAIQGENNQ